MIEDDIIQNNFCSKDNNGKTIKNVHNRKLQLKRERRCKRR